MNRLPAVLLDVDGVLNFFGKPAWPADTVRTERVVTSDGMEFPITWSTRVTDWLKSLDGRAEVLWSTTWNSQDEVRHIERLLGVGPFERAFAPVSVYTARDDKKDAAERMFQEGRPFVWIDDEVYWLRMSTRLDGPGAFLLVEPSERTGLTVQEITLVEQFLAS